jgi:hypothetical protein
LKKAKSLTNTTALSNKKGSLSQELIADTFIKRFKEELTKLGADRIKIELNKSKVNKGRVLHRLRLGTVKK